MTNKEINELETLHNKIYKETEEYGRTHFVSRIVDLEHNWNELKRVLKEMYIHTQYTGYLDIIYKMQEMEKNHGDMENNT